EQVVSRDRRVQERLGAGIQDLSGQGRRGAHRPIWRWHKAYTEARHPACERVSGRIQGEKARHGGQDKEEIAVALTRDFKQTIVERVEREPAFAQALLDEAATLFLNGEPETARLILRDLVNATLGFEELAVLTAKPSKSLHRMLSPHGNPSMDNLAAIFGAIRKELNVGMRVQVVKQAGHIKARSAHKSARV